jgi:predicted nucleic acid-binding protein
MQIAKAPTALRRSARTGKTKVAKKRMGDTQSEAVLSLAPPAKQQKTAEKQEDVEMSEICRLHAARNNSIKLQFQSNGMPVGNHPRSAGIFKCSLASSDFKALLQLYTLSKDTINKMVPWGNGPTDPRRRGYTFLPSGPGMERLEEAGIKISCEGAYDNSQESANLANAVHEKTVAQACGKLLPAQVTEEMTAALKRLLAFVKSCVQAKYKQFCSLDELFSLQPNLHQQALSLPLHLDSPRYDGFGVVIVTIAMAGSAEVLLVDDGEDGEEPMSWSFPLQQGELYVLSGNARNKCLHGVIADAHMRESFNLRLGLHTKETAHEEVQRHWPD